MFLKNKKQNDLYKEITTLAPEHVVKHELLSVVIKSFKDGAIAVPLYCIFIGAVIQMWTPLDYILIWVGIISGLSILQRIFCKQFFAMENPSEEELKKSIRKICTLRFFYSLMFTTLVLWGWPPGDHVAFMFVIAIVLVSVSQNVFTSSAYPPLMYLEVFPRILTAAGIVFYVGYTTDSMPMYALAISAILQMVFMKKLATEMRINALNQIKQKYIIKKALDEAEQASESKSKFLAMMSHEVRTPMNGILGMANLLRDTDLSKKQTNYLETIRYSAETLIAMLNEILDYSKAEAGHIDIEAVDFDLIKLVNSCADLMRSRAHEKGIDIIVKIDPEVPPFVNTDPTRLRQIVLNLLGNAVKFTEEGSVSIEVENVGNKHPAEELKVSVIDTGIGIPEDKQQDMFEDFTQADESIMRRFGGTGLGLSICKKILHVMNGDIGVNSEPDKGSTFWFTLPVLSAKGVEISAEEWGVLPEILPLNVLVVDDNDINLQVATDILQKYKHTVTVAKDGAEAFEKVQAQKGGPMFDIILMDIEMPEMNGFETTSAIRKLDKPLCDIPILALSAHSFEGERSKCLDAGMQGYVPKPFDTARLLNSMADVLPDMVDVAADDDFDSFEDVIEEGVDDYIDETTLDLTNLQELENAFDRAYVISFLEKFLPDMKRFVAEIETLGEDCAANVDDIKHKAHELKSMSKVCGLSYVSDLAMRLEYAARDNNSDELAVLVVGIEEKFEKNLNELLKIYPASYAA